MGANGYCCWKYLTSEGTEKTYNVQFFAVIGACENDKNEWERCVTQSYIIVEVCKWDGLPPNEIFRNKLK